MNKLVFVVGVVISIERIKKYPFIKVLEHRFRSVNKTVELVDINCFKYIVFILI